MIKNPSRDFWIFPLARLPTFTLMVKAPPPYQPALISTPWVLDIKKIFYQIFFKKASYQYSKDSYAQASDLDTSNNYLQSSLSYETNTWDVSFNPYLQNELWSNQEVSQRLGSSFKASYTTSTYDAGFITDYYYQKAILIHERINL